VVSVIARGEVLVAVLHPGRRVGARRGGRTALPVVGDRDPVVAAHVQVIPEDAIGQVNPRRIADRAANVKGDLFLTH